MKGISFDRMGTPAKAFPVDKDVKTPSSYPGSPKKVKLKQNR
jgi:hypothetical protein